MSKKRIKAKFFCPDLTWGFEPSDGPFFENARLRQIVMPEPNNDGFIEIEIKIKSNEKPTFFNNEDDFIVTVERVKRK